MLMTRSVASHEDFRHYLIKQLHHLHIVLPPGIEIQEARYAVAVVYLI